jgi:uncharacterized protein
MFKNLCLSLAACASLLGAALVPPHGAALAAPAATSVSSPTADPSSQQIYAAARAGDLGQAQQMIERVLQDHPRSAKAHYVAAEVYARSGDLSRARGELAQAQSLSPGLPFASPRAVQALQQQLTGRRILYGTPVVRHSGGISWGLVLLIAALGAVIFALLRRRSAPSPYAATYGSYGTPGQPGAYPGANPYGPSPGSPSPYGSSVGGPGLMGSLATGLAVGAGVAAGEQLVQHMLGGGSSQAIGPGSVLPGAQAAELPQMPNADMGGNDFGLTDGGSWDSGDADSGGADFGGDDFGSGGGDWT